MVTQPAHAQLLSERLFVSTEGRPAVPPAKPAAQLTAYAVEPAVGTGGMTVELANAEMIGCESAAISVEVRARK